MFGNLVGFGGGVFLVPILVVFFNVPMPLAVSTSLVSLVPSSIISTINNHRRGMVLYKVGLLLEAPTIVGTVIGSLLVSYLPVDYLKGIFILFLFLLGASMLRRTKENGEGYTWLNKLNATKPVVTVKTGKEGSLVERMSVWMLGFFGMLSGLLAGMLGIGGGFLKTPIMIKVFKIPPKNATATALFMIIMTSSIGTLTHYLQGALDVSSSLPVMLGFMAGAILSGFLHVKLPETAIGRLVGVGLLLAGIALGINVWIAHRG